MVILVFLSIFQARIPFTVSSAPFCPLNNSNPGSIAPKVICLHKIWHPNIDPISGFVMLPILGSDWRPVLSINTVLLGLQLLFLEPNPKFSVNMSAAEQLIADPTQFAEKIQEILHGGSFFGISFPSCVQLGKKGRSRDDEEEPIEFIKKRRRA